MDYYEGERSLTRNLPEESMELTQTTMSCTSVVDIHEILQQCSTEKHYIEYDGFLSNHLPHATIALFRLGLSRDTIERFIHTYIHRLEPVTNDPVDDRPAVELKGERVAYYSVVQHYETLYNDQYYKDIDAFISNEYPKVSEGLGSSLLHGTIHLGYGYSVGNIRTVLEGLAYTFHSFRPINTTRTEHDFAMFGHGSMGITDVLVTLRNDTKLQSQMFGSISEEKWTSLKVGPVQLAIAYLTTDRADLLIDLVLSLKFDSELIAEDGSLDPVRCMRQIVYWVVQVYALASTRNNFFLLHCVTCSWSLLQIISLLKKEDAVKVIRELLVVVLAVYVTQGCPELNVFVFTGEFNVDDWTSLVEGASDCDRDEHCFKIIQVCKEMVKDAQGFGENHNMYMQAARSVLDNEFNFFTYGP